MAANIDPIYSRIGDVSNNSGAGCNGLLTAAAGDYTGISTNTSLVFTSDATNGSYVQRLRMKAGGTNVASVMRIFLNNGQSHTTAGNNEFYGEVTLPATTINASAATIEIDYPMNFVLPSGWTIWCGLGTGVAAGWVVTPIAGRY